jgi:ornithine cyclodeaminase/alanine dehydrogenase-like protein (mu-crystallin family)
MSRDTSFRIVPERITASLVDMREAIETMRMVYSDFGRKSAVLSSPVAAFLKGDPVADTLFKIKGGYVPSLGACGYRVVGDVGLDGVNGEHHYCYLLDEHTAVPRALVAQTHLHRLRTAACGLVGARVLTGKPDGTFALIGAGKIGRHIAEGFKVAFPNGRLVIASRRRDSAAAMVDAVQEICPGCEVADTVADAVAQADTVIAITTSDSPIFEPGLFKRGMTIVGMGEHHELDFGLVGKADGFFTDDIIFATTLGSGAAWVRTKQISLDALRAKETASIGAIVAGLADGRGTPDQKILSIVMGFAIGDLALAEICRRKAVARNVGFVVDL